jgi:uncharacterized membrane protein
VDGNISVEELIIALVFLSFGFFPMAYVMVLAVAGIFTFDSTTREVPKAKFLSEAMRRRIRRLARVAFIWMFYIVFLLATLIAIFD